MVVLTIASGPNDDVGVVWNLSVGSVVEAHVGHEVPHAPVAEKCIVSLLGTHDRDSHDGHKQGYSNESHTMDWHTGVCIGRRFREFRDLELGFLVERYCNG